ncbi:glycine zipper domain-containing protein [Fundidesulfovibrio terrae]|uniref:glycine zipper domain-containing protein n=1 Tax=Fundidesulfovibrio terrae TaxID=2922866 RepID=UPI001FAFA6F2|nr:glycine zipper domain-containing protein [Fundidesulfovibrio terrae]
MSKTLTAGVLACSLLLTGACTNMTKTQQGALSGGAIGAGAGAGIAAISGGYVGVGAAIGGALGAVAGGLYGHEQEKKSKPKTTKPQQ